MPTDYLQLALDLYRLTKDPLALDAIRALENLETPQPILASIIGYLNAQQEAALTLYGNGGTYPGYGNDRPDPSDF